MLRIALPHVNVLSKLDLLEKSGALKFDLEFYMNVVDVRTLLKRIESEKKKNSKDEIAPVSSRKVRKTFAQLNQAFCDIVEDFNLVSFLTLSLFTLHLTLSCLIAYPLLPFFILYYS